MLAYRNLDLWLSVLHCVSFWCCMDCGLQIGVASLLVVTLATVKQIHTPAVCLTCFSQEMCIWLDCRASSLDSGRTPEEKAEARRSRRIRTVDYSRPGADAPFSVPSMSGMAGRSGPLLTAVYLLPCACFPTIIFGSFLCWLVHVDLVSFEDAFVFPGPVVCSCLLLSATLSCNILVVRSCVLMCCCP